MRTPWRYISAAWLARDVGTSLRLAISGFITKHPQVTTWLLDDGADGRKKLKTQNGGKLEAELIDTVAENLGAKTTAFSKVSRWRPGLVRVYVAKAKDPETQLADWLEFGAPTGVDTAIPACGIFPKTVAPAAATSELWRAYAEASNHRNYKSADENHELFSKEVWRFKTGVETPRSQ